MKAVFDPEFRTAQAGMAERSVYRRSRGGDPVATIVSLAVVGLVGAAFVTMSPIFVKKQAVAPTVVKLLSLPSDPPPEQPRPELDKPVTPPEVQVVTPPPQVMLPPVPAAPQVAQVEVARPAPPAPQAAPAPPAPALSGPVNAGELSAKMISADPPSYPLDSRRAHEQGTVVLDVLLGTDGRVSNVSIARSSGFDRLDKAAMNAVRRWRWSPLMRDGAPVMVRGVVTIPFILQGGRGDGGPDHHGRGHGGRDHGRDGADRDDDGDFDHS